PQLMTQCSPHPISVSRACYVRLLALHSFPTRRSSDLMNKIIIYLSAVLLLCSCGSARHYAAFQYDNGDDYVSEGLYRIVDRKGRDRKSTRLNSSHVSISYAVVCLKREKRNTCARKTKC